MADTLANGWWLTVITMTVVFIVLYVLALMIRAIKLMVAPFGNDPRGKPDNLDRQEPEPESGDVVDVGESEAMEVAEELNVETTAVIAAALAAYLEKPAFVPAVIDGKARREESLWAMAGRMRVMQARELAKRRATA